MRKMEVAVFLKWLLGEKEGEQWNESDLSRLADRHRILLYPFIRKYQCNFFSDDFVQASRLKYFRNIQRVKSVEDFLIRLNAFLSTVSAVGIVLKGTPLASRYYESIYHRHSRDVDILIQSEKVMLVAQWLISIGYRLQSDFLTYSEKQQVYYLQQNHHFCFYGELVELPEVIELHWRCRANDDVFTLEPFSRDTTLLQTDFDRIFTLHHLDHFIYLCVHGTEHRWYRIKWLLDLPMMARHGKLNWHQLPNRAAELGALEHLYVSLYLLRTFIGKTFIHGSDGQIWNDATKYKVDSIIAAMQDPAMIETGYKSAFRQIFYLASFNRRFCKWTFWKRWMISPTDWKTFPIPEKFYFLYYFLRPVFWVIRKSLG